MDIQKALAVVIASALYRDMENNNYTLQSDEIRAVKFVVNYANNMVTAGKWV